MSAYIVFDAACVPYEHQGNTFTSSPCLMPSIYFTAYDAYDVYKLLFMGPNPALPAQVGTWLHFTKLGSMLHSSHGNEMFRNIKGEIFV